MSTWSYQAPPELSDEQFARWQELLEQRTGICFFQHKSILQKGLSLRMREIGVDNYETYYEHVSAEPQGLIEWTQLVDRISVKETSFFRDPYSYNAYEDFLRERIPASQASDSHSLDIWSVGCSTGEEPYSLAMIADQLVHELKAKVCWAVTATDISHTALQVGKEGRYLARKAEQIDPALRSRYISSRGPQEIEVSAAIKQRVCFIQNNMLALDAAPEMEMDVIFCQNVLVYFRQKSQCRVLDVLVNHLKPGGLLMLGPGEVIGWNHPEMKRTLDTSVLAYKKC